MTVSELYEKIGGNYEEAVGRLMNDDLIITFIGRFVGSNFMERLETAFERGSSGEIFEAAHAFKGVASNLALTKISGCVEKITDATRPQKEDKTIDIKKELNMLKEYYIKAENEINNFLKQQ
ncbi:MAG: Hpt domain-containing protein [Firmicutes bacterium]|nr:Hpt domain-containing protein [Bacillota bacterium]